MTRLHVNELYGTLSAPLTIGATTWSGAEVANLPVVTAPDILAVTIAPLGLPSNVATAPEIIHVTAHTSAATSATISRGEEGTAARAHATNEPWVHAVTAADVAATTFGGGTPT